MIMSEQRCTVVDRQWRESEGKVKIEGYMSVSDEEAHQRLVRSFTMNVSCHSTLDMETMFRQVCPVVYETQRLGT